MVWGGVGWCGVVWGWLASSTSASCSPPFFPFPFFFFIPSFFWLASLAFFSSSLLSRSPALAHIPRGGLKIPSTTLNLKPETKTLQALTLQTLIDR